jgi:hypothetical protein
MCMHAHTYAENTEKYKSEQSMSTYVEVNQNQSCYITGIVHISKSNIEHVSEGPHNLKISNHCVLAIHCLQALHLAKSDAVLK